MPFYYVVYTDNLPVQVTEIYAIKESIATDSKGLLIYAIVNAADISNALIAGKRTGIKRVLERNSQIMLMDYH